MTINAPHTPHARHAARSCANSQTPLLEAFRLTRRSTQHWASELAPEDMVLQSMSDASPIGWHLAHTTWFFEEFLLGAFDPEHTPFHPRFGFLFNSYYEAVGERVQRHQRGLISRPGAAEILRYRAHVEERVEALLERLKGKARNEALRILEIGVHHEQQHQELMVTDLKHAFWHNPLRPALPGSVEERVPESAERPPMSFVPFAGGVKPIGTNTKGPAFAFDNEGPAHEVLVQPFELADRAVTAGEWIEFIEAGGYRSPEHWLSAGWNRIRDLSDRWDAPLYWEKRNGHWFHFTAAGDRPVDPNEPVTHLSYFEADAYARWRGARLPTEFEWETAARASQGVGVDGRFRDSGTFHPAAAPAQLPAGAPAQMMGNVWEWTSSAYAAFPGFKPDDGALGEYNGKFMCGQFVLRGGSCATPTSHIRTTYRNFFPAETRWQFSGVRLARDTTG